MMAVICKYPGYHTFNVNAIVDDGFAVKVKYTTFGFDYPIPVETAIDDYANPTIEEGVSWVSLDTKNWDSIGNNINDGNFDLCIRAYLHNQYPVYKNLEENSPISIFPNPAQNFLNCKFNYITENDIDINVFNYFGTLLITKAYNQKKDDYIIVFDISGFPKEIYYLSLKSEEFTTLKTIVKL